MGRILLAFFIYFTTCINHVWAYSCGDYTNGANMGSSGMINLPGYYYENGDTNICPSGYYCPGNGCARQCSYHTLGKYTMSDTNIPVPTNDTNYQTYVNHYNGIRGAVHKSDCYQYFSCENVKGDVVECKGYNQLHDGDNDNQVTQLSHVMDPHDIKCSKNGVGGTWDPYKAADNTTDLSFDDRLHFEYEYDPSTGAPLFATSNNNWATTDFWAGKTCYFNVRRCTKFPRIMPGQPQNANCLNLNESSYDTGTDLDRLRENTPHTFFNGYAVFDTSNSYGCRHNYGAAWHLGGCDYCETDRSEATTMTPNGSNVPVNVYGTIVSGLKILDYSDEPTYQFLPTINTQNTEQNGCTAFTTFNNDGTAVDTCPSGDYAWSSTSYSDKMICYIKPTYIHDGYNAQNTINLCFCNQLIFSVPTDYRIIKCKPGYYADAIYDGPVDDNDPWEHPGCARPKNNGNFSVCNCNPVPAGYFRTCTEWGSQQNSNTRATAAACLISNWGSATNVSQYRCPYIGQTTSGAAADASMCRYGGTKLVDDANSTGWTMPNNDSSEYEGWEPVYTSAPNWN